MSPKQSSTHVEPDSGGGASGSPPPRRRFGQNFLVAPGVAARIADAAAPEPSARLLEIGPGKGALTEALLARARQVHAVEIDRDLAAALRARFPADRLALIEDDILRVPLAPFGPGLVVVGNLPYNVSKPVALRLVEERGAIARAVLMFQREVAERLTASPGVSAYGPLTVLTGRAFAIERLFDVPPGAFRPRPKVTSTVTLWLRRDPAALPDALVTPLKAVLRATFARRRQTIHRNLRAALSGDGGRADALLDAAAIDPRARAETVPPEGFLALARAWLLYT